MFDLEGKLPNEVEMTGSTLSPPEIQTANTPPVHDIIHRQGCGDGKSVAAVTQPTVLNCNVLNVH